MTARLRLTLSYALFAVLTGAVTLAIIYLAMRWVPNYPLTPAHPRDTAPAPSRQEILDTLLRVSGYALTALAVIGLAGGWLIAGRVLSPLKQLNEAARIAAEGSLGHRIAMTGRHDEFTDLADTFDAMLDRLQRSFERQQRFAANASHELRTPLSITRTMLDVAAADPDGQDYARLTSRLQKTNQRSIEIVEALLQLSALRTPLSLEPTDLAETTAQALETVRKEAETLGLPISADLTCAPVLGSPVLLRQLATNLLENALRHNVPGGAVTVTVAPSSLTVTNTGPLIPPGAVDVYREPFARGKARTAGGGHGLGLTLVADIAEAHHGRLLLTPNPTGGLTAEVALMGVGAPSL
jgi:two-component system sensor histidine kinase VanS